MLTLTLETIYILKCKEGEKITEMGYYTSLADAIEDKHQFEIISQCQETESIYYIIMDKLYRRD